MSLLLLVDILDDYSEMDFLNIVGDFNYGLLVQFFFIPINYLKLFVSIVY